MKFIVWTTFGGTTTPILADNVVTRQTGPGQPGRYSLMKPATEDGEPFQIVFGSKTYKVSGVLSVPEDMVGMYAEVEEVDKPEPGDAEEVLKHSKIDEGLTAKAMKEAKAKKPVRKRAPRKRSATAKDQQSKETK